MAALLLEKHILALPWKGFCASLALFFFSADTLYAKAEVSVAQTQVQTGEEPEYAKIDWQQSSSSDLAEQLGFMEGPDTGQVCRGYYVEPSFSAVDANLKADQIPIHASADQTELSLTGVSTLKGNVILEQPNQMLGSDLLYIHRSADGKKLEEMDAYGHVYLRRAGELVLGDHGTFNLSDKTGQMDHVLYRHSLSGDNADIRSLNDEQSKVSGVNAWGSAEQFNQTKDGLIVIQQASYTTCPPLTHIWSIKASQITLNRDSGEGKATQARLYYKDVPIFYTPYLSFPIDDRRKSGVLLPTAAYSSQNGYDVSLPYYFNLAPNYDTVFTPEYISERGLNLNDQFRYLASNGSGNFHGSFLPQDREFSDFQNDEAQTYNNGKSPDSPATLDDLLNDSTNRYFLSWRDTRQYDPHWSSSVYANRASDDYYFQDFSNDPAQTTDNQIYSTANVAYNSEHIYFSTILESYQTLHPVNEGLVLDPYQKLPEIVLNAHYPEAFDNIDLGVDNQFDYFTIDQTPGLTTTSPEGSRAFTEPKASWTLSSISGYIKPAVELSATQYNLSDQLPGENSEISRVLPISDIDSGLYFDKDASWFGHSYQQTLEPRLFYLYVPYRNQDDIPLFDTTVEPFTYQQLFRTNRFTGEDRIGDTDQISYALTSRILDGESGEERMHASIGEIYYFENRRVNIDPNSVDIVTSYNSVPSDNSFSPVAAEVGYQLSRVWSLNGNLAWNPEAGQEQGLNMQTGETDTFTVPKGINNGSFALQYKKDNSHIFNAGYTFLRGGDQLVDNNGLPVVSSNGTSVSPQSSENDLSQTDLSAVFPLSAQWKSFARWNYNLSQGHSQNVLGGIEYDSCCWSIRLVEAHAFDYLDAENNNQPRYDNTLYLQFAFIGLGNVSANNASGTLVSSIPGYTDTFGAPLPGFKT